MPIRVKNVAGETLRIEDNGSPFETVVVEGQREHREGVFSVGDEYEARCSCGWSAGPFATPAEARGEADAHAG